MIVEVPNASAEAMAFGAIFRTMVAVPKASALPMPLGAIDKSSLAVPKPRLKLSP